MFCFCLGIIETTNEQAVLDHLNFPRELISYYNILIQFFSSLCGDSNGGFHHILDNSSEIQVNIAWMWLWHWKEKEKRTSNKNIFEGGC